MRRFNSLFSMKMLFATHGVVSLKRLLNQSNLKSWSSKMIKKSLEAYFFTLKVQQNSRKINRNLKKIIQLLC